MVSSKWLLSIACLLGILMTPAALLAQDGGGRPRKVQAFLIPFDRESVQMATRIGGHVERTLQGANRMELVDLSAVLSGQPGADFLAVLEEARTLLREGITHYEQVRFTEATESLKKSLEILKNNAAWVDRIPEYSEALSFLAASHMMAGQPEAGRKTFKELLLFNPNYTVDTDRFDASMQLIVDEERAEIQSGPMGSISVSSDPPGARVFVSGQQKGFTPLSISRIPTGPHVLRLEQLGTMPHGELIEVTPTEDGIFQITLRPTEEFERLQSIVSSVGQELTSGRVGPAMIRLGKHVGLDWAIYGVVQRTFGSVQINAWVVNIGEERRLATRRFEFPLTDFALDSEVREAVQALLDDAWRREQRDSGGSDPLGRRSGTERWFRDREGSGQSLGGSSREGRRGRGGDPLDERDGTEGW